MRRIGALALVIAGLLAAIATVDAAPTRATPTPTVSAPPSAEPSSATDLFRRLAGLPGLRARFREEKQLAMLIEPLVSEGTVWFVPPAELIRVTTAPTWSSLRVRPDGLTYSDETGVQRLPLAKDHPARAFVQVFSDVVRGDLAAVERNFAVGFTLADAAPGWQLRLTPRKPGFAGITAIEIRGGGAIIGSLDVVDTSGDRSHTTFSAVAIDRRPSAAELAAALERPR